MAKARKIVEVAALAERVNSMLAAPNSTQDGRVALAVLIESTLMDTGNYHGFAYLPSEYLPAAEQDFTTGKVLRDGYDDTRRRYF